MSYLKLVHLTLLLAFHDLLGLGTRMHMTNKEIAAKRQFYPLLHHRESSLSKKSRKCLLEILVFWL